MFLSGSLTWARSGARNGRSVGFGLRLGFAVATAAAWLKDCIWVSSALD